MSSNNVTRCANTDFHWGERTYIMGIVNASPDSFSGDGAADVEAAVAQACRFADEGADILDIGGESTRPGFSQITIEEEIRRVIPLIEQLAARINVPISIDTSKYEVARQALAARGFYSQRPMGIKNGTTIGRTGGKE